MSNVHQLDVWLLSHHVPAVAAVCPKESVREIDTLKARLTSEGRRAGVLGAQVSALQGQVRAAGTAPSGGCRT